MKFTEHKPGKRDLRVRAGEVFQPTEELVGKFDARQHLTELDWQRASNMLPDYWTSDMPTQAIGLIFFERLVDQSKSSQEWDQADLKQTREWFEQLGGMNAEIALGEINRGRTVEKIQTKIYARQLFPKQPLFSVTTDDLNSLILMANDGVFSPPPRALEIAFFKKQCPTVTTTPVLSPLELTDGYLQDIVQRIQSNLNHPDLEFLVKLVAQIVMLKVVSPESFLKLALGQRFWEKALGMLEQMRKKGKPPFGFFKYAANLQLLSAEELKLDEKGNIVMERGKQVKLEKSVPLPDRDVS